LLIRPSKEAMEEYKETNQGLTSIRFVPEDMLATPAEVIIYGTKVALISFNPTLIATVIDNKDINETFNQLFDYIWKTTKPFHEKTIGG
jgi:hypothetical protein